MHSGTTWLWLSNTLPPRKAVMMQSQKAAVPGLNEETGSAEKVLKKVNIRIIILLACVRGRERDTKRFALNFVSVEKYKPEK